MNHVTQQIKIELWKRFGTKEHPAEWDGTIYGGGLISQRYWEYFKSIEMLDLDETSIVLDIGGGSPVSGAGFFSDLLSQYVKKVIIMDTEIRHANQHIRNIEFVRQDASYDSLIDLFTTEKNITHISSISVFEHIEDINRQHIVEAVNSYFEGDTFVTTLEYNATHCFFNYQLTAGTLSSLFKPLKRFYLDKCEASPVWCENAFDTVRHEVLDQSRRCMDIPLLTDSKIPLWYPLALKFVKIPANN